MFTRRRDGSKVALVGLVGRLRECGFRLFDIQMRTEHTFRLGAVEIPRAAYLARLGEALACRATFDDGPAV
jgi:leucyl/phenylalanyl-tRNA--protein transferase